MAGLIQNIEVVVVGPIETNCYLVINQLKETIIIDPGADPELIIERINQQKLKPIAIINTHGHYDHILANRELKDKYKVPIYFPEDDKYLLPIQKKLYAVIDFEVDYYYTQSIAVSGFDEIKVIHTPGHTKGSSCLLINGNLFSGDMMFAGGYLGRTDLWGGSEEDIQNSLTKLIVLEDNLAVYPGHGPATTIGLERGFYA